MSIVNALPGEEVPPLPRTDQGVRICQILGVKEDKLEEYKKVHTAVWPSVLRALRQAKIFDYSIHHTILPFGPDGTPRQHVLIAHMRYLGDPSQFQQDMARIGEDPQTQKWWSVTDPLQTSFVEGATGSASGPGWWQNAEEVFRFEG